MIADELRWTITGDCNAFDLPVLRFSFSFDAFVSMLNELSNRESMANSLVATSTKYYVAT